MLYKKIIGGCCIVQTYNEDGECIKQQVEVHDHGDVEYETEGGTFIDAEDMPLKGKEHFPLTMAQPVIADGKWISPDEELEDNPFAHCPPS